MSWGWKLTGLPSDDHFVKVGHTPCGVLPLLLFGQLRLGCASLKYVERGFHSFRFILADALQEKGLCQGVLPPLFFCAHRQGGGLDLTSLLSVSSAGETR